MPNPNSTLESLRGRAYHREGGPEKTDPAFPAFSVVIPTYNRPRALQRCLGALAGSTYPRDRFEVIVVDDGGTTPLDEAIDRAARSMQVRLLTLPHSGPGAARNAGAANAGYPFLAFTDDDCLPSASWLSALGRELVEEPSALVGGATLNGLPRNRFSAASQSLVSFLYAYYNRVTPRFFCSNNLALAKAAFLALGGFDVRFAFAAGEDRDLCDRWSFEGRPARYAPDAVILHAHELSPRTFWRQHMRYGRAAAHFRTLSAERRGAGVAVEPMTFYTELVRAPFTSSEESPWTVAALLAVSQAANAAGFFYETFLRRIGASRGVVADAAKVGRENTPA